MVEPLKVSLKTAWGSTGFMCVVQPVMLTSPEGLNTAQGEIDIIAYVYLHVASIVHTGLTWCATQC